MTSEFLRDVGKLGDDMDAFVDRCRAHIVDGAGGSVPENELDEIEGRLRRERSEHAELDDRVWALATAGIVDTIHKLQVAGEVRSTEVANAFNEMFDEEFEDWVSELQERQD